MIKMRYQLSIAWNLFEDGSIVVIQVETRCRGQDAGFDAAKRQTTMKNSAAVWCRE